MDRFKVCVLGGSGFIGTEICRLTVAMGHRPISVSRGGRPDIDEPWVEGVEWVAADVLDTGAWQDHLQGCEALVHSVGVVDERRAQQQTFARLNRDSPIAAARAAQAAGVPKFVFLSCAKLPPEVPHAYLQSKLDAEASLQRLSIATAILRPVLVTAGPPLVAKAAGAMGEAASHRPEIDAWAKKTRGLRREKVAMAALRAALQPETVGVLEVDDIEHLGDAMFIQ